MGPDDLAPRLEAFLAVHLGSPVRVRDLRRLPGGASRVTWAFTTDAPDGPRSLVLRQDPPGATRQIDPSTEVELLRRAAAAGVPVPDVLWTTGEELGDPGFVMVFVEGETIPRRILRDDAYAGARAGMAARCGEILARIHAIPVDDLDLEAPAGRPGRAALERYRSLLDAFGEPHPALELGARRLELSAPDPGRITLVHGDFRNGNLIVGPDGVRAVLDWELAHVGDPWEDLGWLVSRTWRFGEPGEVGGFGDREDLYRAYERTSGVAVDRAAVAWWEAAAAFTWGVMCVIQSFVHLGGRSPSLEHAAIGRRAAEAEYDLLRLVAPEDS